MPRLMTFIVSLIFIVAASQSTLQGSDDDLPKPFGDNSLDIYSDWSPGTPWLSGLNYGWEGFNGSITYGSNFFWSSTIGADAAVAVKIRFSTSETTFARTYRRDFNFAADAVGIFQGSAWDVSDPANHRRLNILFIEDNNSKPANLLWDPNDSGLGGREYLLIMNSDYDGNGQSYGAGGLSQDVLYGWWPRLETGHTLFETDPAALTLGRANVNKFAALPFATGLNLHWEYTGTGADNYKLYAGTSSPPQTVIATLPVSDSSYSHTGLSPGQIYYYRIDAVTSGGAIVDRSKEIAGWAQITEGGIALLGQWNDRSEYGDVWGYTAPDNKEYALLNVRGEGISIIDISGADPVEVGFATATDAPAIFPDAKDVKVYDHYAILINEHQPAQVFDLADVTTPVQVSTIHIGGSGSADGGAHNAYVDGNYLYVIGGHGPAGQGLSIFDLTDPANPVEVGGLHEFYYHDFDVRNDTGYASAASNGIDILDLSNKSQPTRITNFGYEGQWIHNATVSDDGNFLYVGDENGSVGQWTRIYDISDIMHPVMLSEIIVDSSAITHNSYAVDGYLYIAHYSEGLHVYNVSDGAHPQPIAFYDTYLPQQYGFVGAWSVYPFFASKKLLVSDMQSGLFVLTLSPPADVQAQEQAIPGAYHLAQNYPNPFNPATTISFDLPEKSRVNLTVYDILGREVVRLVDEVRPAGYHELRWGGRDAFSRQVASGIYFARFVTPGYTKSMKMLLLK